MAIPRHARLQPSIHAGFRHALHELTSRCIVQPPPATPAERRVLRWLLIALSAAAISLIAYSWRTRSADCVAACRASGAPDGKLRFNAGGRLNLGTHCECIGTASPAAARQTHPQ